MNAQAIADLTIRGSPETGIRSPGSQPVRAAPVAEVREATDHPDRHAEPSLQEVVQATEGINAFLRSGSADHIQFAVHEKANRMMVQVIDDKTREVVRTIPPKELLDLAAKIGELVGTLLDQRG
jgi:flagellar protein FlaG